MSEVKHTQGPWVSKLDCLTRKILSAAGSVVAIIPNISALSHERQTANANLIAAAPELLAVCEDYLKFDVLNMEHTADMINEIADRMKAVVSKAKGQA